MEEINISNTRPIPPLLYKEFNKPQKKKDLEDFDKYLIILGSIALAEQKPEDFEHRY
ncbi:4184_t:CDS:2 [Dentiscutata erythropus]|uniref:4184_t:CDS:1 n=1 Tax=Dentiscutata erythropus TaxID=1348616 RepID=A0A9N8VE05_9GLOM|nr:4184_t:CDS:2 [Dentiscutata erythropus]